MNLKLIIGVVILLIFLRWVFKNEIFDTMCPLGCSQFGKTCFEGNSKYFSNGKYRAKDTLEDIFRKMEYLNSYTNRIVTWRRCFIVSVILTGLIFVLTNLERSSTNIFIVFVISFICTNGMLSFYRFHLEVYPQGFMQENINALRKRLKQYREPILNDDIKATLEYISGKTPQ